MIIYVIQNLINGKCYVGQTHYTIDRRWSEHLKAAQYSSCPNHQTPFMKAIRKYGKDKFALFVLYRAKSDLELNHAESFYIRLLNSHSKNFGYNATFGGEGGIPTDETRKRSRNAALGRTLSPEHRLKISIANKGQIRTPEQRKRMSEIGRALPHPPRGPMSDYEKQKRSSALTGKPWSQARRLAQINNKAALC